MSAHQYPKGRCAEGKLCRFPHLWLRPQDKCPDCGRITHPLCGVLTESKDKYRCQSCAANIPTSLPLAATTVTQSKSRNDDESEDASIDLTNVNTNKDVDCTEIVISQAETGGTVVSGITDEKDRTHFTAIPKDYFITSDQNQNVECKKRDGDIWLTLRKAVSNEIDADLKAMMILRSQEIGLKIKVQDGEKDVKSWSDIGEAWKNDDSLDTAKKLYEIVHATFEDNSGFEIYMESKIMDRLELRYNDASPRNKGCIARMVMTRKSELNKLINKRTESTHQKKISSKRIDKRNGRRQSKGTFTIKGPNNSETYNRDGSLCGTTGSGEINRFDSHYYMEKIRKLQQEKSKVGYIN